MDTSLGQPNLTKYARYIYEKANIYLVESDHAFITYSIEKDTCMIHDLWVDPEHRKLKIGSVMADHVSSIAKDNGCSKLVSTVMVNSNGCEDALVAQVKYGFKIIGSDSERIYLSKGI